MKCPKCDIGELHADKVHFIYKNTDFGEFDAEVCNKCGETYLREQSSKAIEDIAIQLGVWGIKTIPEELDTVSTHDIFSVTLSQLLQKPGIQSLSNINFVPA